jgi:hypothetical protein
MQHAGYVNNLPTITAVLINYALRILLLLGDAVGL